MPAFGGAALLWMRFGCGQRGSRNAHSRHDGPVSPPRTLPTRGAEPPASPAASRHRAGLWKDPRLVVGVALVAASALIGATLVSGGDSAVGVWAAREALARGQSVTSQDLVRRAVHFGDQRDADRYLSAGAPPPAGAVLGRDVGAGELVPRAAIDATNAGTAVEVPLSVPSDSVPATVRRGSVVDVWVTPDPTLDGTGAGGSRSTLVFAGVRVLAVTRPGGALGPGATRQVIVGVDTAQERALPTALARLAHGSVVLVRRP